MKYPNAPPITLATVQIAANRQASRGRAMAIGISSTSGGMGKQLASKKATAASHQVARGEAVSARVRA